MANRPVHGGNVWAAAQKWGRPPHEFLDYSANINPLGPAKGALKAIQESVALLTHYPEPTGRRVKEALQAFFAAPGEPLALENLVLGNGGAELIYLAGRMFYKKRAVLLAPTFSEYGEGIENPKVHTLPLSAEEGFRLPVDRIVAEMEPEDLLYLGNPNNPTGALFPREEIRIVLEAAGDKNAIVVVDEAFIDFVGEERVSVRSWVEEYPHLVVVGSLTKFFAIPGLRLGYAVAAASTARRMESLLPTWRVNTLALAAGEASLSDTCYIEDTRTLVQTQRVFLTEALQRIKGLKVYPSVANYLLVDGSALGLTAEELQQRLGPHGILIRNCGTYQNLGPGFFRLAVRRQEENQRLITILKEVT